MASYLKQWRRRIVEVNALAENSSDENEQYEDEEATERTAVQTDSSMNEDMSDSDYGYTSIVLSSSESENEMNTSSESDIEDEQPILDEELAEWATTHKCTRTALNGILDILRRHGHRLPKDARTLLNTPRIVVTETKAGGQYIYFGIESGIKRNIAASPGFIENREPVELFFNIDGVPLFKSTNLQFWPILCKMPKFEPFIVALFCGQGKPDPLEEYITEFLEELEEITNGGINLEVQNVTLPVILKGFICDAPARAFLKCVKAHNSYFGCERCQIKGTWTQNRVVFYSEEDHAKRTDEEFSNFEYDVHQLRRTPLINASIPCISSFVLDYMHLVCLGVVKRILCFLKQGPTVCRLSVRQRGEISENLLELQGTLPSDFARQPRSLVDLDRWKATEFRQFLLYTGPVVLRNIVSQKVYIHFLTLSVAMSIMLESNNVKRNEYLPYAKDLIDHFVECCPSVYGPTFTVYNVHTLKHVHEDVQQFSCSLNDISCFPFENHLQSVKKHVKKSQNPIAQVTKRLQERENSKRHHQTVALKPYSFISERRKDRCFLLNNDNFAIIKEKQQNGKLLCDVLKQCHMSNLFEKPCKSKLINMVYVRSLEDRATRTVLDRKDLHRKAVCLSYKEGFVLCPLLHGIESH